MKKRFKSIIKKFSKDSFIEITEINKTKSSINVEFNTSDDINQYLKEKIFTLSI